MEVSSGGPAITFRDEGEAAAFARQLAEAIKLGYRVRRAEPPRLLSTVRKDLAAALASARFPLDTQVSPYGGSAEAEAGLIAPPSDQPDMLGTELAARLANVTPRTVRTWIRERRVEARRGPRGVLLVDLASLAAEISRRRAGSED